jgi:hypothetical protein
MEINDLLEHSIYTEQLLPYLFIHVDTDYDHEQSFQIIVI